MKKQDEKESDAITLKDGTLIEVLPITEHVKYIVQQLDLVGHADKDIEERIRKGFANPKNSGLSSAPKIYRKSIGGANLSLSSRARFSMAHAPGL